jgi:hypothetical protein
MSKKSRFISVEIVVKTDGDCDAFVDWFRSKDNYVEKIPCNTHRWYVYFAPLPSGSADMTIRNICEGIPGWPEVVRRQWDEAAFCEFLVGYEIGTDPSAHLDHFDPITLKLAAQVGAGISLALYPPTMGSAFEPPIEDAEGSRGNGGQRC